MKREIYKELPEGFKPCRSPDVFFSLKTDRMKVRKKDNLRLNYGMRYIIQGHFGLYYERIVWSKDVLKENLKYINTNQLYYDAGYKPEYKKDIQNQ